MAQAGDLVSIRTTKEIRKGIFLESSNPEIILLKLDSGYNIGILKEDIQEIKTLKKQEKAKIKKIKQNPNLPKIGMIVTGGTISAKLDYKTGGVSWLTDAEELLTSYPELLDLVNIKKIEMPYLEASENMSWNHWQDLAKSVEKMLQDKEIQGIIITHGTDFLHYSSAALSFCFPRLNKPVILTYSQRSSDRASSDARLNLICAAQACLSDIGEVILVGHASTNDDFCYAHHGVKVKKMHSSKRDAFQSINSSPIAKIYPDKIEFLSSYRKKESEFQSDIHFSDKVALLKFYPGQNPDILEFLAEKNKAIIIEASGLGHVLTKGNSWLPIIKKLIKAGKIICISTQTVFGKVDMLVYGNGRDLLETGVISCEDMHSETAFIKLGYLLGDKLLARNIENIKKKFRENLVGEFSSRF